MNYDEKLYKSATLLYCVREKVGKKRKQKRKRKQWLKQAKRLLPKHLAKHITRELIKDVMYDGRAVRDDENINYDMLYKMVNRDNLSYFFLYELREDFAKIDVIFVYIIDEVMEKQSSRWLVKSAEKWLSQELKQELTSVLEKDKAFVKALYDLEKHLKIKTDNEGLQDFLHYLWNFISIRIDDLELFLETLEKMLK